jgi:hypothetical protein
MERPMNDRVERTGAARKEYPDEGAMMATRITAVPMLLFLLCSSLVPSLAGAPDLISYQGRLTEIGGNPIVTPTELRFRIYLGGDGTTLNSSGLRVYDEIAAVEPSSKGIFSHLIGSGTPAAVCDDGPCELTPEDFGDGVTPVWIEVRLDPDGVAGTPDDEPLLPRTRVGTVGYAYRVASLDGAEGGALEGPVSAETLTGRAGATLGDGSGLDVALTFDGEISDAALIWLDDISELFFSSETRHQMGLSLPLQRSVSIGPIANPTQGTFIRYYHTNNSFADGDLDGVPDQDQVVGVCYNCREGISGGVEVPDEYALTTPRWTGHASSSTTGTSSVRASRPIVRSFFTWTPTAPGDTPIPTRAGPT